ncbi:MAG: GDSL-type esterase/lipase family protein [Patescibacteria group bacterium]
MNINPQAKIVVCYGDSNTWGHNPLDESRYPANIRWVGVLQERLGNEFNVINEGLNGRTFVAQEPEKPYKAGLPVLKSILETNRPIDVMTIMLGTNDLKSTYHLSIENIIDHLRRTIEFIKKETKDNQTKILIICPAPVVNPIGKKIDPRLLNAPEISEQLPQFFEKVAKQSGCLYLDAGKFISLETTDGYHFAPEHHKILGEKVAEILKK